ncbi:MAG TPA: DUF5103 domain-containing protein [Flavobacterium sp.]|jgi:hypothetical protein
MLKRLLNSLIFLFTISGFAQIPADVAPPFNIKTVSFVLNGQVAVPLFSLNDAFALEFDDLYGNEANYYYEIVHCDYDWKPSQLAKAEYLQGFDNQRIQDYTNSFNTLQLYSHYRLQFPNRYTQFRVSGNYIIRILNEDKDLVFSRKFILYEDLVSVPLQVRRARNVKVINERHNLDFAIKSQTILFQNPLRNIKVLLMQNGRFDNAIMNVKPQYTIGNDLIYKYDTETQFWAGNEFLYFENKDIRAANNYVSRVTAGSIYNSHLYTHQARASSPYTLAPDINGGFLVNNIGGTKNEVEADYAWVYFSLSAPAYFDKKDIYINGMFNNYAISPENKMEYNPDKQIYEKAIIIKQGFTNYQFVVADSRGKLDEQNAIDGNFYQTENNYFTLVYYREGSQRYDRVIGKGVASSIDITN